MIASRVDLHAKLDGLLRQFHQDNAGLRLDPHLRRSFGELKLDFEAHLAHDTGTCDMADARLAIHQLQEDMRHALRSFLRLVPQAIPCLEIDYINGEAQATLSLTF